MTLPAKRPATYADIVALPEHLVGDWIVAATHGGDDRVRAAPFEAIALELARLWA